MRSAIVPSWAPSLAARLSVFFFAGVVAPTAWTSGQPRTGWWQLGSELGLGEPDENTSLAALSCYCRFAVNVQQVLWEGHASDGRSDTGSSPQGPGLCQQAT